MSKLVSIGLLVGAIGIATVQTASAQCRNYGSYYQPYYGWYFSPSAPAVTFWGGAATSQTVTGPSSPAAPGGQTAQSQSQTYRSFSAEPAPAPAYQAAPAPAYGGSYGGTVSSDPGNLNASQNNPTGTSGMVPSVPSYGYGSSGMYDTANNHGIPYGTTGGGASGGGTQGGTAGRPY